MDESLSCVILSTTSGTYLNKIGKDFNTDKIICRHGLYMSDYVLWYAARKMTNKNINFNCLLCQAKIIPLFGKQSETFGLFKL